MIQVKIKNFTELELQCRCCGLFNMDDDFLIRLQAFRFLINKPLTVTSGCRCKKHNKEVGGVETSCHQSTTKKASACDVTNNNCSEIYTLATKSGLFNEVIWYKAKNFVHLALDKNQKSNYFKIS